jgi:hypothetical protein
MKTNMGSADRIIRVIIAAIIGILYYTQMVSGTLGIALLVVAGVLLLTSLTSSCPLYSLLGFSTGPKKEKK